MHLLLMIARMIFISWPSSPTITSIKPPPRRSPCEESARECERVALRVRIKTGMCFVILSFMFDILPHILTGILPDFCLIFYCGHFSVCMLLRHYSRSERFNARCLYFDTAPHLDYVQALCGEIAALEQNSTKSALKSPVDSIEWRAQWTLAIFQRKRHA